MLSELLDGFMTVMSSPNAMIWCVAGVTMGTLIGALPGLGPITGIALLLPLTFQMDQLSALILLMSIYLGTMYGGRISSILINVPGDGGAIVTTFDGHPLARKGKAGYALTLSAISSFIGGLVGFLGMVFLTSILAELALIFGPTEYFSLILFTLIAACGLTQKRPLKPIIATLLGLLISAIATDPITGTQRLTFGIVELWDGINIAVVGIGLFGISETLIRLEEKISNKKGEKLTFSSLFPKVSEVLSNFGAMIRGSIIGFVIGVLPGTGALLATFMSYSTEKKLSKTPEKFGTGVPQGLSGPEAANNASVGGALIPTFALGIPGSAATAVLLGGLMMVGLQPGPLLFENSSDVVWASFAGFFIANILLLILNTAFVPAFAILIQKAEPFLVPIIAAFCFIGVYMINHRLFDIGIMIVFGILGYFMRKANFPLAPFFFAFILGSMLEQNLREALLTSTGDLSVFFTRPISLFFIIISIMILLMPILRKLKLKR
ncbi:tripartite tricarboxylate transporter permease [Oceanobacillus sp. Castelsardo]|uniref:tripartite tricarboxylate transporter permease n=1 Tax=Oceanobacillus sp. Castelsardo TaxID=1851204 RepID=UPI0009EE4B00|nr:tripartite tricarboxylate transporter permease [Oceanobacillus sp. Castelsardo]